MRRVNLKGGRIVCFQSGLADTRQQQPSEEMKFMFFTLRKQQHNWGLRVHSSRSPRLRTLRVLGRGHWVGSEFHRDIVSAGFIQELKPFAVTGVTWWPCHLNITWRFKNRAVGSFFNSTRLRTIGEQKQHLLKAQGRFLLNLKIVINSPEFQLLPGELYVEFRNHVSFVIIWSRDQMVNGACCNVKDEAKIQK